MKENADKTIIHSNGTSQQQQHQVSIIIFVAQVDKTEGIAVMSIIKRNSDDYSL